MGFSFMLFRFFLAIFVLSYYQRMVMMPHDHLWISWLQWEPYELYETLDSERLVYKKGNYITKLKHYSNGL
jgi:hypothetical protein